MGPGVRREDGAKEAGGGRNKGEQEMRETFQPCVYILASRRHGTLYVGVTSNLLARLVQHREGLIPGFTHRYGIRRLAYYEMFDTMEAAIVREKRLKEWRRAWKIELIEAHNENWDDLGIGLGLPRLPDLPTEPALGV
jgi:putative endonuclease